MASSATDLTPESVSISAADVIRARNDFYCNPIIFRFKNKDGILAPNSAAGNIEVLFDQAHGDLTSDMGFYDDAGCSTTPILVGSPVSIAATSQFRKIYVRSKANSIIEKKSIRFKVFDGVKTYFPKYSFEVVRRND